MGQLWERLGKESRTRERSRESLQTVLDRDGRARKVKKAEETKIEIKE